MTGPQTGLTAWDVELEGHVRQALCYTMTREGQLLLRHLLIRGKIETLAWFISEIPRDVQGKQMEIAIQNGIVLIEQEKGGLQKPYYVVNPEYVTLLKRVLPEVLR